MGISSLAAQLVSEESMCVHTRCQLHQSALHRALPTNTPTTPAQRKSSLGFSSSVRALKREPATENERLVTVIRSSKPGIDCDYLQSNLI